MQNRFLFIPGLPKSGTTFLTYSLLESGIISPYSGQRRDKELTFFFEERTSADGDDFLACFAPENDHQWLCDGTPAYVFEPEAVDWIAEVTAGSEVRFVFCLRERVRQMYSWYTHYCIHQLVKMSWQSHGFRLLTNPDLFDDQGIFAFMYQPISPFVRRAVELFGRDSVSVFNHHTDYASEAPFWSRLSSSIGGSCSPHPTLKWHQNFFPELIFFDRPTVKTIAGRDYEFEPGDLLFAAEHFSKLYRNVEDQFGRAAVAAMARASTDLDTGTIELLKSRLYPDFHEALDILGVDPASFPEPESIRTKRPAISPGALSELRSTPAVFGPGPEQGLDHALAGEMATEVPLSQFPEMVRVKEERDHARRYPWKYIRHALKLRLRR